MKVLKRIFLVLFGLVVLVLIGALFIDGKYAIEKQITINRPVGEVFSYIKLLRNQDQYSVWQMKDPTMKKNFFGEDGTVGFVAAWDSENENVGKGEQEITAIVENSRIDSELRFFEPFEAKDQAYMTTNSEDPNSTLVKWGFTGEMHYPMNTMMLFMDMEEMIGNDLQVGLNNLKKKLEK